jgi:hypothetical protein
VLDDSMTTFSATATNDVGTSGCSAPFTYTEVTPEPTEPPTQTPSTGGLGQTAPSVPAKKKCKKKKKQPAASVAKKKKR